MGRLFVFGGRPVIGYYSRQRGLANEAVFTQTSNFDLSGKQLCHFAIKGIRYIRYSQSAKKSRLTGMNGCFFVWKEILSVSGTRT